MNLVGKILIVVQVFMSICFMLFAGAVFSTHQNWQASLNKSIASEASLKKTLEQTEAEFSAFKDKTTAELGQFKQRADTAESNLAGLQNRVSTLTGELQDTRTERDSALAEIRIASEEARSRQSEAIVLRDEIAKQRAKIDEQVGKIRGLDDDILDRDRNLSDVESKHLTLLDRSSNMERLLRLEGIDPNKKIIGDVQAPPPDIEARVVVSRKNTQQTTEFVQISAGSDDGLEVGHELVVYRAGKYLGNIRLINVHSDDAVGVVVERTRNGVIDRGDYVKSRT